MTERLSSNRISTKQQKIAMLAEQNPRMVFTTLAHHIDLDWMREAWRRTRKDRAPGIDDVTTGDYAVNLEENLASLLDRFKSGRYRAPAVKRKHIPKGDGEQTRPIGIPTLEDKILQRAVVMVLEPIYERDFSDCSYGFRPKRSTHQALEALWGNLMQVKGGWVLELDIRRFFDEVKHQQLRGFMGQRVNDGVIRRIIGKWLKAGVMEDGQLSYPEDGTPQGGVISPLLANIYLHEVLDRWYAETVRPRMRGESFLVRYADDAVLGFAREDDARRVFAVLEDRFAAYGLRLHPDKTRLVPFQRPRDDVPRGGSGSFDFLGFTHYWGRSRKGWWIVQRRTAKSRYRRTLRRLWVWCKANLHRSVPEQHAALTRKVRGHYAYFGVTGNAPNLARLLQMAHRIWRYWLNRRSNRSKMPWSRFNELLRRYPLPRPKVYQSIYR